MDIEKLANKLQEKEQAVVRETLKEVWAIAEKSNYKELLELRETQKEKGLKIVDETMQDLQGIDRDLAFMLEYALKGIISEAQPKGEFQSEALGSLTEILNKER